MTDNKPYIKNTYFWIGNFLLWAMLCGFSLLQAYGFSKSANEGMNWTFRLSYTIPFYFSYWLMSYLVYLYYQKINKILWPKIIAPLVTGGLIFSTLHLLLSTLIMTALMSMAQNPEFADKTFWTNFKSTIGWDYPLITNSFLVYWLMIIIMFGLNFYRKFKNQYIQNLELESQLTQSELQTLKMQLQPHFLFNALNTISMMIRRKKDEQAVEMISGLSDLLRTSLTRQSDQFVTLKEELELIKKYLEIEQNRFKENIKVVYEIDSKTEQVLVPNLILQPLIENCIKHGLSKTMGEGLIKITSKIEDGNLQIMVFNTSPFLNMTEETCRENNGIGLSNTKKRLSQLYKSDFNFNIEYQEPIGVQVMLTFPIVAPSKLK